MSKEAVDSLHTLLEKLEDTLAGRTRYEVHYPSGEVKVLSWNELHVDLKHDDRALYEVVKYRPIYPERAP